MRPSSREEFLRRAATRRAELAERLDALFPDPDSLSLEIGSGHGHWLVDYAAEHPGKRCLGIDLIGDRVERAQRKADRRGVENVAFLKADALDAFDCLPARVELAEVFLLFLDPWPKKRHWKNRLFNGRFLQELAQRCGSGTRCHFRTDHLGYFQWALRAVENQHVWDRVDEAEWPFERETVFQSRAESYQSLVLVRR